jgi:hypothetical protein
MRTSKLLQLTLIMVTGLATAEAAEARRARREGFNFGTSVRLLDGESKTTPGIGSDQNTQVTSDSQAVSPYLGYAFSSLNLGLSFAAETGRTESVERSEDGNHTTTRKSSRRATGGSLFARFMFGEVFFFEAAGGLYQEQLNVSTESKETTDEDGGFVGEGEAYEVKGVGPGYHLAAGLELPMGGNFFFTSTYQFRMVTLRDYPGGLTLGKKRSVSQKREALFGIAYYHR